MKNKILIFFDLDIVIRAFYQSNTFEILEKNFEVEYVFPKDDSSKKKYVNIDFNMFSNKKTHFVNIKRNRMGMWINIHGTIIFYHRGKSTTMQLLRQK